MNEFPPYLSAKVNRVAPLLIPCGLRPDRPYSSRPAMFLTPEIDRGSTFVTDKTIVPPEALIEGLLHRSTKAVFGGSSKAGKTWFMLDLALSVANGRPFLKWNTTPGKALFINLEINKAFFKDRVTTLMEKRGVSEVPNLDVWNLRGIDAQAGTFLRDMADSVKNERYALIVIDPIYKLMTGQAENSSKAATLLCHGIDQLASKTGAAVVYGHHFTKGGQAGKKAMDRLSGSGVLARDADTIITLTEHRMDGCYTVETTLRNMASTPPFVVEWNYPVMEMRDDLDPDDILRKAAKPGADTSGFLLALLMDRPRTTTDWEEAAAKGGVSRATFYRLKAKMAAAGDVIQDPGSALWHIAGCHVSRETYETSAGHEMRETRETPETFGPREKHETRETSETSPSGDSVLSDGAPG